MLPVLRSRGFLDSVDHIFDSVWNLPAIETRSSFYSTRETEDGYEISLTVPVGIEIDEVQAEVQGNVLRLTLPKPQAKSITLTKKED